MPGRQSYTLCRCRLCCEATGGKGRLISSTEVHAHLVSSRTATQPTPPRSVPLRSPPVVASSTSSPAPQSRLEDPIEQLCSTTASMNLYSNLSDQITSETFAATLHDEGTDPSSSPDKLWTSRAEFQRSVPNPTPNLGLPPLDAVLDGMQRLSLESNQILPQLNHSMSPPPPAATPPRPVNTSRLTRSTPLRNPLETEESRLLAKREASQHTTKVLGNLAAVERKITIHQDELHDDSSIQTIQTVERSIEELEASLLSINRDVPCVVTRKADVGCQLSALKDKVETLRQRGGFMDPVFFSSGKSSLLLKFQLLKLSRSSLRQPN
jgi:hypothetical protein